MFLMIKTHFVKIGQNFKSFFSLIRTGKYTEAFKEIGYAQQAIFYWIGFGFALSAIVNLMLREDLKSRNKILPILGYSCVALFSLFAGLILAGVASTLIPFLVIIGTIVSFANNFSQYLAQKAEKKALGKKMQLQNIEKEVQVVKEPLAAKIKDFLQKDHFDRDEINTLFYRIGIKFLNETEKAQEELMDETKDPARQKKIRKELKELFKEKYGRLLDFIALKQNLHFLNKSVNRLAVNNWLFGTVVALNVLTATIFIATTPWIYGALGFCSVGLWLIASINVARLMLQKTLSDKKIALPRKALERAIIAKVEKPEQGKGLQKLYQSSTWVNFFSFFTSAFDSVWSFLSRVSRKMASWQLETKAWHIMMPLWQRSSRELESSENQVYKPLLVNDALEFDADDRVEIDPHASAVVWQSSARRAPIPSTSEGRKVHHSAKP